MNKPLTFIKLRPAPTANPDSATAKRQFEATSSLMTGLGGLLADDPGATISLEWLAANTAVDLIVAAPADWQAEVTHLLYAAYPTCQLIPLDHWPHTPAPSAGAAVQFAPSDGRLRLADFAAGDPLQPLLEVLSSVSDPGTALHVQLTLTAADQASSLGARAIAGLHDGLTAILRDAVAGQHIEPAKPDTTNSEEKRKTASLNANLRLTASGPKGSSQALIRRAAAAFHGLSVPGDTKLRYQMSKRPSSWAHLAEFRRHDTKTSFLLTPTEAANLFHPPTNTRAWPALKRLDSTRLPIPAGLPDDGITVGFSSFRDSAKPIRLAPADRLRHTYLIGQTGTGKSTLFQSAILQDMQNGEGCCFIDPHGEVIDWLLPRIPPQRAKDVILFDPSDPQALLGLNLLEWHTPEERDLIIQELIALFYKLFDPSHTGVIGPQFEHWLRNAALTVTEPAIRGTLTDIPRLFTDPAYQKSAVAASRHPAVRDFWLGQMAGTSDFHKSEMLNYFTSKFGGFLGNAVMKHILSQPASAFDLRKLMDRRKILLVNLSKGKLGSLNAQLLGTLIVTKIQMAAMSRADVAPELRPPFYVYIDEFQNIVTDSFAAMLSEIRKYGVGLHLAHQYVDQLPETIKQAILGNVGTLMAFRLGHADAQWLAPHFAPLTADDLTGVPPFHYHLRTLAGGQLTTPFTVTAPRVNAIPQPQLADALRSHVRRFVATQTTAVG